MVHSNDGCLARPHKKEASATLYLVEELGDARLRCDQLMRYIDEAVKLIEKSEKKDHFMEVAGHLITGMPETAFKLQKALQAVALAAGRIDYEELKQELRPEKVDELERVLKEVRIRPVQHRSEFQSSALEQIPSLSRSHGSENPMITPKQAAVRLREFAHMAREEGSLPFYDVAAFIRELNPTRKASAAFPVADALDRLAGVLDAPTNQSVTRQQLATLLSRMAMESEFDAVYKAASQPKLTQDMMQLADVGEVKKKFKEQNPDISDAELEEIAKQWTQNKDVVKDKTALDPAEQGLAPNFESIRTQAIAATRAANAGRWRPALLGLYYIVDEIGTVLVRLGSMDTQKSEALKREIRQQIPQIQKNVDELAPMAVQAAEADITKLYHEMMAHLDTFDMSWGMYERNPEKNRAKLDDALRYMKALQFVAGVVIRNLEKKAGAKTATQQGEQDPWKVDQEPAEEKALRSRFEQGESADPTENMDSDDAKQWKENTDEHKDNFKEAAGRWKALFPKSHSSHGHFFDLEADGASFRIEPLLGPNNVHVMLAGEPMYRLLATIPEQGTIKYRRQLTDISKLKSVAEAYAKTLAAPAGGVDFTKEWSKTALGPDGNLAKFKEGEPADPTDSMSPEDAAEWKENTEEHKDNFKSASSSMKDLIEEINLAAEYAGLTAEAKSAGSDTVEFGGSKFEVDVAWAIGNIKRLPDRVKVDQIKAALKASHPDTKGLGPKSPSKESSDDLAWKVAGDDGFEEGVDKGKFTIILSQPTASKWRATYINPQGGSGSSSGQSTAKAALQVALGRIDFEGQKTVKVLTKKLQGEEWVTTKTETVDTGAK